MTLRVHRPTLRRSFSWALGFVADATILQPLRRCLLEGLETGPWVVLPPCHEAAVSGIAGGGGPTILASRLRFCAIAASVNSNCAPLLALRGPVCYSA